MIKGRRRQTALLSLAEPLSLSDRQTDGPIAPKPPLTMARVWILRALVPLNRQRHFVKDRGFEDNDLALHLGLDRFVGLSVEDFEPNIVKEELRAAHAAAEETLKLTRLPERVTRNIERLGTLVGLSEIDKRILEFRVALATDAWLGSACEYFGAMNSSSQTVWVLSGLLDLPRSSVREALDSRGMLARSGLLTLDRMHCHDLRGSLDLISCDFADLVDSEEPEPIEFLRDTILPSSAAHLTLDDFVHLGDQLSVLRSYVQKSIETKRPGVNILLHGSPGTGKSQFGKALAQELGVATYEVSSENASGDVIDAEGRLRAYRATQGILSNTSCLIVFDETEDIFQAPVPRRGRLDVDSNGRKAWINRMLESNTLTSTPMRGSSDRAGKLHGRMTTNARKLAGVLAIMNGEPTVNAQCVQAALAWVRYGSKTVDVVASNVKDRASFSKLKADAQRVHHAIRKLTAEGGGDLPMRRDVQRNLEMKSGRLAEAIDYLQRAAPALVQVVPGRTAQNRSFIRLQALGEFR